MFESTSDLGLDDEASALVLVRRVIELHPLESDNPVQLLVAGDEDLARVRAIVGKATDDAEAALGVGGRAFLVPIRRALTIGVFGGVVFAGVVGQAKIEEAGLEVEVRELFEAVANRGGDSDHGQAALGVEAVLLEVLLDQGLEDRMSSRAERAAVEQDLAQGLGLIGDPGVEAGQEGVAVDEVVLECQQAEQQALGGVLSRLGRRIDMRIAAEDGIDRGAVVGEPPAILVGARYFNGAVAKLAFDTQELLEQKRGRLARPPEPGSPRCADGLRSVSSRTRSGRRLRRSRSARQSGSGSFWPPQSIPN